MTPETLTPTAAYMLVAGLVVAWAFQKLKPRWPWLNSGTPKVQKVKKATIVLVGSLLAQIVPAAIALATKHETPNWSALGNYAWSALMQWVTASGVWALLLRRAQQAANTETPAVPTSAANENERP